MSVFPNLLFAAKTNHSQKKEKGTRSTGLVCIRETWGHVKLILTQNNGGKKMGLLEKREHAAAI